MMFNNSYESYICKILMECTATKDLAQEFEVQIKQNFTIILALICEENMLTKQFEVFNLD